MSIACVASDVHACDRSVYLGGGDAERARIRLLRGSNTAGCNWRRDFRISVFPLDMPRPPFFDVDKGGVRKLFFGNRLDTAPRWSTLSLEARACRIQPISAHVRRERPLALCTTYATCIESNRTRKRMKPEWLSAEVECANGLYMRE
jgi:hypothetical protein